MVKHVLPGVPTPAPDPIHSETAWWFWDETWADRCGPFGSRAEAEEYLTDYVHALKTGEVRRALPPGVDWDSNRRIGGERIEKE